MIHMCHGDQSGHQRLSPQTSGGGSRRESGRWMTPMPPVGDRADHYGVDRSTATRAMRTLAGEGLVRIVPRWRTFRA
jgi:DNA-binding transcriptional MocR family regulator